MARIYIHELADWPRFTWNSEAIAPLLSEVRLRQGLLLGRMKGYGFASQWAATLKVLTEETIQSSAIEGVVLDPESVRSSIAKKLGLKVAGLKAHEDRNVEGVVEMMLDATQRFEARLTRSVCLTGTRTCFLKFAEQPTSSASGHGGMTAKVRCR